MEYSLQEVSNEEDMRNKNVKTNAICETTDARTNKKLQQGCRRPLFVCSNSREMRVSSVGNQQYKTCCTFPKCQTDASEQTVQIQIRARVIKHFSCSTQLSMKFVLLINLKLLTIAYSFLLNTAKHENFSANNYENANYCWHFHIY